MKINKIAFVVLMSLSTLSIADPYVVLGVDGTVGRDGYPSNDSFLIEAGVGADTKIGWFIEFVGAINLKEFAFDNPTNDKNQHIGYFMPITGYKLKINRDNFVKAGVGYQAGFFDKKCYFSESEKVCDRSEEYGPSFGLGYYYSGRSRSLVGIEYRRYDLSESRQYDSISLSINGFFR